MNLANKHTQPADAHSKGPQGVAELRCLGCDELLEPTAWFCECCGHSAVRERVEMTVDSELALVSDLGKKRRINQDCGMVVRRDDGNAVMVVADGVSSSWRSERAASVAAHVVSDYLKNHQGTGLLTEAIQSAISSAHAAIKAQIVPEAHSEFESSESTIVVALQEGEHWGIGWVGDSRAYRLSGTSSEVLTIDDSWEESLKRGGDDVQVPASLESLAGVVTQTLGMLDEGLEIHTITTTLAPGERLLLCTDGLWGYFESAQSMADELTFTEPSNAINEATQLVMQANARGGKDNVTVAVAIQAPVITSDQPHFSS
jgi:serine/threonine protein phosphatase PrpC